MKSTAASFPRCVGSPHPGGTPGPVPAKDELALKRQRVARILAESAKELAQLTTLVQLSELVRKEENEA